MYKSTPDPSTDSLISQESRIRPVFTSDFPHPDLPQNMPQPAVSIDDQGVLKLPRQIRIPHRIRRCSATNLLKTSSRHSVLVDLEIVLNNNRRNQEKILWQ